MAQRNQSLANVAQRAGGKRAAQHPLCASVLGVLLSACQSTPPAPLDFQNAGAPQGTAPDNDGTLIVDCLLPGQIKKMGSSFTYISPRRPVKVSGLECEIRGGEYVAFDRADFQTALNVWLPQAQQGDSVAQTYVAAIYEKGLGVPPDYKQAAQWYRQAAEQGYPRAQYALGYLYESGLGVERDPKQAFDWYRKAAGLTQEDVRTAYVELSEQERQVLEQVAAAERATLEKMQQEVALKQGELNAVNGELDGARRALEAKQREADAQAGRLQQARERERAAQVRLAAHVQQLTALDGQVAARKQELSQLDATVAQQQVAAVGEIEQRKASLRAELQQIEQQRAEAERQRQAAEAEQRQLSAVLQQAQQEKVAELARQTQIIAQLEAQARNNTARLAQLQRAQAQQTLALAAPKIEFIDPQVPLVRSPTPQAPVLTVRSGVAERALIGRVLAAQPLMMVTLNDVPLTVGANGLFNATVPIAPSGTLVDVVAVDRAGNRGETKFVLAPEQAQRQMLAAAGPATVAAVAAPKPLPDIDFGSYHALLIGNNDYKSLPKLATPINDVDAVAEVLRGQYGFKQTIVLKNATRYDIVTALNKLRKQLTEKDNLLIYYAGHGELDRINMTGQWLPIDAETDNTANWLSNSALTELANAIPAKHVMVVADSCYSGIMTRSALATLEQGQSEDARLTWIKKMIGKRSRTVLTSGGVAPVLDEGGGDHSVFARALLDTLRANNDILEGQRLSRQVSAAVAVAADRYKVDQVPEYAPIKHAGHESGDFFLVPRLAGS